MDKRGQFMALYIPIIALFMVTLVVSMYWIQNSALENHMVSPVKVLQIGDSKDIYEMAEKDWICSFYISGGSEEEMKKSFCQKFSEADESDFIFDLMVDEKGDNKKDVFESSEARGLFCNENYKLEIDGSDVMFGFDSVKMADTLTAMKKDKINFVVDWEYLYKREGLINIEEDCNGLRST